MATAASGVAPEAPRGKEREIRAARSPGGGAGGGGGGRRRWKFLARGRGPRSPWSPLGASPEPPAPSLRWDLGARSRVLGPRRAPPPSGCGAGVLAGEAEPGRPGGGVWVISWGWGPPFLSLL